MSNTCRKQPGLVWRLVWSTWNQLWFWRSRKRINLIQMQAVTTAQLNSTFHRKIFRQYRERIIHQVDVTRMGTLSASIIYIWYYTKKEMLLQWDSPFSTAFLQCLISFPFPFIWIIVNQNMVKFWCRKWQKLPKNDSVFRFWS